MNDKINPVKLDSKQEVKAALADITFKKEIKIMNNNHKIVNQDKKLKVEAALAKIENKNIMFGSETYPHINGELQRAIECVPNSSLYGDQYLDAVEAELGKFHRGLAVLAKVHLQFSNGGFSLVFFNGYMSTFKETIEFLKIISKALIIDQTVDEIIKVFEEAIGIHHDYEDEIDSIMSYYEFENQYGEEINGEEYYEWSYRKEDEIDGDFNAKYSPLEQRYFNMDVDFLNQLDLLVAENTRCRINLDALEAVRS